MRPVRYVEAHDGRSLAWTRSGTGVPLVKAAAWLTHLEYDDESPIWANWVSFLESHFDYLRYDERGCGLSDRDPGRLDLETWTDDLRRIVTAADMPRPFWLFAVSQGTGAAVSYAARYPEDVAGLIVCGGYARGVRRRGNDDAARLYDAMTEVFRLGWDSPNSAFREVFTKRFVPDGNPDKIGWFNDLCRRATTPEVGAALMSARADMDASAALPGVRCPTLVLHARGDLVSPLAEGQFLARHIPNAELVVLDSSNHILQSDEPAWGEFCARMLGFVGPASGAIDADLTAREREILDRICAAESNKQIARHLGMSEKTVRNHATRIFAKLGVSTRQEALLRMKGPSRP